MSELQNYCTVIFLYVKFQYVKFCSINLYDFFRVGFSKKCSLPDKKSPIYLELILRHWMLKVKYSDFHYELL